MRDQHEIGHFPQPEFADPMFSDPLALIADQAKFQAVGFLHSFEERDVFGPCYRLCVGEIPYLLEAEVPRRAEENVPKILFEAHIATLVAVEHETMTRRDRSCVKPKVLADRVAHRGVPAVRTEYPADVAVKYRVPGLRHRF